VVDFSGRSCLVTGATGFLGSHLVAALVEHGARVRCLVRSTSRRDFLPTLGVELVTGDVTIPESLPSAVDDVDYVFHLAGLIKASDPADYFRVNYLGTIALLEACRSRARQLQRVLIVSSLAAAGPSAPGRPVTESWPCRPVTPYGKSKLLAEQAASAYVSELPITIIRPPTIYGPRDRETLLLFRLVALGIRPHLPVRGEISIVHATDLVTGILLAATHPAATGETFFIAGDEILSFDEVISHLARAVGRQGLTVPVPRWAVRASARAAEIMREVAGISLVFDRWKAVEILEGYWACSNERARRLLGFAPRIRVADGLAATAHWYRAAGWL